MSKLHPIAPYRPATPAFYWGLSAYLVSAIVAGVVLLQLYPPTAWSFAENSWLNFPISDFWDRFKAVDLGPPANIIDRLTHSFRYAARWISIVHQTGAGSIFIIHAIATLGIAWTVAEMVFRRVRSDTPKRILATHASGPRPLWGVAGVAYLAEAWSSHVRLTGRGISLAPGLAMPVAKEREGLLLAGRPGSGKSVILEGLLGQALAQDGRVFALDVKGGLSARLWRTRHSVLGLTGPNVAVWALGQDLVDDADADEFAASLIPESRDPVWSEGSRLILSALIQHLNAENGVGWGWRELYQLFQQPIESLETVIRRHAPDIANLIQAREDPAAFVVSLAFNLASHVGGTARRFAHLEQQGAPPLSLRAWAKPGGCRDPIVLRYDLQRRGRSAAFAQLCLRLVAGSLLGDDVPDGTDTKTWVFLDEVTRIGRSDALIDLSSLGRSRGVRLVATVQSPAQLTDSYGEHGAKSLRENFGITIICGLPPGENAKEVSENWIGSRVVSMSNANDKMKEWTIPCLSSTEIAGELGHQYDLWGRSKIRAAVIGLTDVSVIDWRFQKWPRPV